MNIKFPIIVVDEAQDVELYNSVDEIIKDVEIYDVKEGIYDLFDSNGRKLKFLFNEDRVYEIRETNTFDRKNLETLLNSTLDYRKKHRLNFGVDYDLPVSISEAILLLKQINHRYNEGKLINRTQKIIASATQYLTS